MGIARPRKIRREFQLDLDDGEDGEIAAPQLIEHHDLDDLLTTDVALPETRPISASPATATYSRTRSGRGSNTQTLTSTAETKSSIDLVISQIASTGVLSMIQALAQVSTVSDQFCIFTTLCSIVFFLAQIDAVIQDAEKVSLLAEHTDQLLVMCSLKLRMTHGRHFVASDVDTVGEVLQCYRGLLATVISVTIATILLHAINAFMKLMCVL